MPSNCNSVLRSFLTPALSGLALASFTLASFTLASVALPGLAEASTPKHWHLSDASDFAKGDLDGLALHPSDGLTVAPGLARSEVDAELIHCWVRDGNRLWLGTGLQAKIFVVEGATVKEVAKLDAAVVGALAPDGAGGVFVGLVGSGKIRRVGSDGKVSDVVALPDVEHVWALLPHKGGLLAATGPGGKVFAVDTRAGSAKVFADTGTEHALTLLADGGAVLIGTAGSPLLLRADDAGKVTALASFPGSEVRALARAGDRVYAAINGSPEVAKLATLKATPDKPGGDKDAGGGKSGANNAAEKKNASGPSGAGAVWVRRDDGQLAQFVASPVGVIAAMAVLPQGVALGGARRGRVVVADAQGEIQTLFDLDEGAVLGLEAGAKGLQTVLTGKSAAVLRVAGAPARAAYTSEVLAESGVARWGRIEARGRGKLVIETRSGYSNPTNDTWSPWQPLATDRSASPAATMLQVRVTFASPDAALQELFVHRRLINRAPEIEKIEVKQEDKGPAITVSWGARDPDGDKLGYTVTYRRRDGGQWLQLHDRLYDKTSMTLSPRDMPDGWYELRIQATDVADNVPSEAHEATRLSRPFLVDQGRPEVSAAVENGVLRGIAVDAASAIVRVEVSINGEPVVLCGAGDGIFDSAREAFELPLAALLKGAARATLLVQAVDSAGNIGVTHVVIGGK